VNTVEQTPGYTLNAPLALGVFAHHGIVVVGDTSATAEAGMDIQDSIHQCALAITNVRGSAAPVIAAAAINPQPLLGVGGVRHLLRENPRAVYTETITLSIGLRDYQARHLASALDIPEEHWTGFIRVAQQLYESHLSSDALYSEINPLVLTNTGIFTAHSGVIQIDPHARFRQPLLTFADPPSDVPKPPTMTHVPLHPGGALACIVNSAGLGMATLDMVAHHGGTTAHFVDVGSGLLTEKIPYAYRLVAAQSGVKSVLMNYFCGVTWCTDVAHVLVTTLKAAPPHFAVVVRIVGFDEDDGRAMLADAQIPQVYIERNLSNAVRQATELARSWQI